MSIVTYVVHENILMKPEILYAIIFDAVYASSTLSSLLCTLAITYRWYTRNCSHMHVQNCNLLSGWTFVSTSVGRVVQFMYYYQQSSTVIDDHSVIKLC